MPEDTYVDVIVAAYQSEEGAKEALQLLEQAKKQGMVTVHDAAVLRKDDEGRLKITDEADKGMGRGALIGGVGGAVIGILAGPIGWATLGGAAIGGLAGKLRDRGFPEDKLKRVGEELQPGSSALIAVIDEPSMEQVERMLNTAADYLMTEAIALDVARQLDEDAERAQAA